MDVERLAVAPGVAIDLAEVAFAADPSGGPGGQHANRSSTRVEVRFNVPASASLSAEQKRRIVEKLGARLTADGTLRVVSARERSQLRNRRTALARLAELLARGLARPRPRRATRPTAASQRERVEAKRRRAGVKRERRRPDAGPE